MKALSMTKLFVCIVLFTCILLVTACGGITITPDGNGGVTVNPNENQNGGNVGNSGNTNNGDVGNNNTPNDNNDVFLKKLETPVLSYQDGSIIYWGMVEGATHYKVDINSTSPSTTYTVTTDNTFIDLRQYYGANSVLQVYITAVAPEGSNFTSSAYLQHIFQIPLGSMTEYTGLGLGQSVNLLTGSYTNYTSATASGNSASIFNSTVFNRMDAVKNPITENQHNTEIIFSTSIESYTKKLTESIGNKFSMSGSVDAFGMAKVTAGYSFNVESEYSKKTYNETQAIFYDMNYTYSGYQAEIAGFSNPKSLSYALSDEFINDVIALENGNISAEKFVGKYGTHVITSGIYGASFLAHYESLMSKEDAEATFGEKIEQSINLAFAANIKGVKIEVDAKNENVAAASTFISNTTSSMQSKFTVKAIGGDYPVNMVMTSLADFSSVCENWAKGIEGSTQLRLIDVPNGSLVFVWDFLGDEYEEAKNILNRYFYSLCDEQYASLNGKVNSMYQDFVTFDVETGTLTIDWSGRQYYSNDNIKLSGTKYTDGEVTLFDYDNGDGIFTVYSKYNGHNVNKVVFKGAYKTENLNGKIISNLFDGISIRFDEHWCRDIVIEFDNFAFEAPVNSYAIDFSDTSIENIAIIATGSVYIKGGNGSTEGFVAINAEGKNVVFKGNGDMHVVGGIGADGIGTGEAGKDGGIGVCANEITMDMTGHLNISGGVGGNGADGAVGKKGSSYRGHTSTDCGDRTATGDGADGGDGTDGKAGGNAGKGGFAIVANKIVIKNGTLTAVGGKSGNGGAGGAGGAGGRGQDTGGWGCTAGDGGDGGDGGNGGNTYVIAASSGSEVVASDSGTIQLIDGESGSVGSAGAAGAAGGKGYHCEHVSSCDQWATWGDNGSDGSAGSAGSAGTIVTYP